MVKNTGITAKGFFLFGLIGLTACISQQKIKINPDKSADVRASVDTENPEKYYSTPVIANFQISKKGGIEYRILNVDSLGNYLSPLFVREHFRFKMFNDSVRYMETEGRPLKEGSGSKISHVLGLTFDKKIKTVRTTNKCVKVKKDKVVILKKRNQTMRQSTNVTIIFD